MHRSPDANEGGGLINEEEKLNSLEIFNNEINSFENSLSDRKGFDLEVSQKILSFLKNVQAGKSNIVMNIDFPFPKDKTELTTLDVMEGRGNAGKAQNSYNLSMVKIQDMLNNLIPKELGGVSLSFSPHMDHYWSEYTFKKTT